MSRKHLKIRRHARHSSENRPTIIGCPTSTQSRMSHKHLKIRSHKRHPNENMVMNILKYALQYHQNQNTSILATLKDILVKRQATWLTLPGGDGSFCSTSLRPGCTGPRRGTARKSNPSGQWGRGPGHKP